ncbi:MAG: hypothetical protein JNL25_13585 [Rhodospirillaceae bacterium]|nr:hypothetical protein [Rhodospirillaceae bacterium]
MGKLSREQSPEKVQARHRGWLSGLAGDQRGSVAIWVGFSLLVFMGCAGIGIDTARGYLVKARLSQALDAAALAGAKSLLADTRDADINMFFNANFQAAGLGAVIDGPHIFANTDTNTVRVAATATIDTTLMSVLGFTTMTVAAEATAVRAINGLDLVVSIDMSGSMCMPCSKIQAAQLAAKTLVETLYNDPNPKKVTIGPTTYSLLNIGLVPWAAKVNVRTNNIINAAAYNPAATVAHTVPEFTNPVTGLPQTVLYSTNISEVLLLSNPPAGWTGGVYARYMPDGNQSNDADLTLGYPTVGGKQWFAYEPIPPLEGEPIAGNWNSTDGGTVSGTVWTDKRRHCHGAYWNDNKADPNHPLSVSNKPSYWLTANPNYGNTASTSDPDECTPTSIKGILPLQDSDNKQVVLDTIANLYTGTSLPSNAYTNGPQGLFWGYEVLMPGAPFNQAKVSVPFKRVQAIVFLTDGQMTGMNGDAYRGVYGPGNGAGTTTLHGTLSNGASNNLNNKLLQLAASIKGANPEQGIKIYVVQYEESDPNLKTLLKQVATEPNAPYYFYAPGATELQNAFKQIAASLSVLRLSQ